MKSKIFILTAFLSAFFVSHVHAQSQIGAAIGINQDGTNPTKNTGAAGGTTGDDASLTNGIVRTNDVVEFQLDLSANIEAADTVVIEATLSDHAIFDEPNNTILQTFCDSFTYNAELTSVTCNVSTLASGKTFNIILFARVTSDAPNNGTFTLSHTVTAGNGVPNPTETECSLDVANPSNGCAVVSNPVTVSAVPSSELLKTSAQGPSTAVFEDARGGWVITYGVAVRNTSNPDDVRGASVIDEASIGVLPDWFTATDSSGATFVPNLTLESCASGPFSNSGPPTAPAPVSRSIGDAANVTSHVTDATWSCVPNGTNAWNVTVTDIDFDRITPYRDRLNRLYPLNRQGFLASAQLSFFIPISDATDNGNRITVRNCIGTPVGDETTSLYSPTDAAGTPNAVDDDPSDNCADIVLQVRNGSLSGSKFYNPPNNLQTPIQVFDGAEVVSQTTVSNVGIPPAGSLDNPAMCDKFDNRKQSLRAPAELATSNIIDGGSATVLYGTGPWGVASGETYVQDVADSSWLTQSTSDCSDETIGTWYTEADIDFTNSGLGMINADQINAVRSEFSGTLQARVGNLVMNVPLRINDNEAGDWIMNYGAFYSDSTDWRTSTCRGVVGGACPDDPVFANANSDSPGQFGDVLLHTDAVVHIAKDVLGPTAYQGGDSVTFELTPDASLTNIENVVFPPGSELDAINVIVKDYLPNYLTYIPGTALLNEDADGNGVLGALEDWNNNGVLDTALAIEPTVSISTDSADFSIPNIGFELLEWNLGDLPFGSEGPIITFDVEVDPFTPNGSDLDNYVIIDADNSPLVPLCSGAFLTEKKCATDGIVVASPGAAAVTKESNEDLVDMGDTISYTVGYGNISPNPIEIMDVIDIFPFNNDANGSIVNDALTIVSASDPDGGNPVEIWASNIAPATLDTRGGSLPNATLEPVLAYGALGNELGADGNGDAVVDWPCLLADVAGGTCAEIDSLEEVTALRFFGDDPNPNAAGSGDSFLDAGEGPYFMTLVFDTSNASPSDEFTNCFGGNFESLQLSVFGCDETPVRIYNGAIGDLIFLDKDQNGIFDNAVDEPRPGVLVNLLDSSGVPVDDPANPGTPYQVSTDSNGRYLFVGLPRGDYIVEIDSVNFEDTGALADTRVSPYAVEGDPNNDANENIDHNAVGDVATGVQSGVVTLGTDEPIGEDVDGVLPANILDSEANQTVDFAFEPLGTIGNYLWFDQNGDGLQNETGTGLEGITVILTFPDGSTQSMITDAMGFYLFEDLPPGDYTVAYDETTLPPTGCSNGQCVQSMLALPGMEGGNQQQNYPISLGAGEDNLTADFGFWRPISTASSIEYFDPVGDRESGYHIEFATTSEISTIGFNVYAVINQKGKRRSILRKINESMIVATGNINQGAVYQLYSPGAGVRGFVIEDIEADGSVLFHDFYKLDRKGKGRKYGIKRHRSTFGNAHRWKQRKLKRRVQHEVRAQSYRNQQQ